MDDAALVENVLQFVRVLLLVFVHELALELRVEEAIVHFLLGPLLLRAKFFDSWEAPRLLGLVVRDVLVAPQFELEVEL